MAPVNPAMITLARESRGWTQKDLASAINVNQATISRYERSEFDGSADQPQVMEHIEAIADVTRFHSSLFIQRTPAVGLGGDFLYRRRASVSQSIRRRVEAEANIRRMQVERLLKNVDVVEAFPFPTIPLDEVLNDPQRAAIELRKAWRMPSGPVGNLTRLIENAGGIVFLVEFGTDKIDGTNLRMPGLPPLLFMNKNVAGERHRFNLAHEVAHLVMHFGVSTGDAEEEANLFAQEFLLPKAEVRSDLKNLDLAAAARLKSVWRVSMALIIKRAETLNVIPKSRAARLYTAMNAKGLRTREPLPLEMEQPEVFERLVDRHTEELRLSAEAMYHLLFTDGLGELPKPKRESPQLRLAGLYGEGDEEQLN